MKYRLTEIDTHIDSGFGVTADAFSKVAKEMYGSEDYQHGFITQGRVPVLFLYRHAIELYLKSLIIIFHKKLNIKTRREINITECIYVPGQPNPKKRDRSLYSTHSIAALFQNFKALIIGYKSQLDKIAPKGDWRIHPDVYSYIRTLQEYDDTGEFFRYPITKRFNAKETEKHNMKKVPLETLADVLTEKGQMLLLVGNEEEVSAAFGSDNSYLEDIGEQLSELCEHLSTFHFMTRMTLCDGF